MEYRALEEELEEENRNTIFMNRNVNVYLDYTKKENRRLTSRSLGQTKRKRRSLSKKSNRKKIILSKNKICYAKRTR